MDDSYIEPAKLNGEFVWYHHDHEDELFLAIKGMLVIKMRDRDLTIHEGMEHLPVAEEEVHVEHGQGIERKNRRSRVDLRNVDIFNTKGTKRTKEKISAFLLRDFRVLYL